MSLLLGLSYNRPKFCPDATWNSNGTTLASNNTIGTQPFGIFINRNNTIFVTDYDNGLIYVWLEGSDNVSNTIVTNSSHPYSIFVNQIGDLYLNTDNPVGVDVWKWNSSSYAYSSSLSVIGNCRSIFADTNGSLYCSIYLRNRQVVKISLNGANQEATPVAGTECAGFFSDMLNCPRGIFVDTNFDLYVADSENHRIQRFPVGQSNGVTIAGRGATGTIDLKLPTGIALDADGYLFIVDSGNHRILGSGPDGFRCVVGCSDTHGPASYQLISPIFLAFDSHGGIFTTDSGNGRVQYFQLSFNSCSEYLLSTQAELLI